MKIVTAAQMTAIEQASERAGVSTDALMENLAVLMDAIVRDKPDAVKGAFLRTAYITSSMGPSVMVDVGSLQALKPAD